MPTKRLHAKFQVPNFKSKSRKRVPARWRKQRGIDNKMRVDKKGHGASPKIGYKNSAVIRFARPDGSLEVLVHNESELLALAGVKGRIAVMAHDLSKRSKASLQGIADSKGISIANRVKK